MSHKILPYPCDYTNTSSVRRARRGGNMFVIILCIVIALLLGAGTYFALTNQKIGWKRLTELGQRCLDSHGFLCRPQTDPAAEAQPAVPQSKPASEVVPRDPVELKPAQPFDQSELGSIPDIVDAAAPGVCGVLNYKLEKGATGEPKLAGSGSGFIYTEDGYIITNHHVVEGASKLKVSLQNGDLYDAALVGGDVMTDVAVLKIDAEKLRALPIGDSAKARVGEFVLAIGDPISADELSGSVTFGIVSALSREINIEGFVNEYLQTDAAVNPGNSGGPLINMRGEVIGVTSAKYTSAGVDENGQTISSEGIGFALPINNVIEIAHSLIQNGSTVRPGIGISIATYTEPTATIKTPGVYILEVTEDSPAEIAGVKVGDHLIAIDGAELTQDEFVEAIRAKRVGDSIVLKVEREGEILEITVTVGDMNQIHR